MDSFCSGTSPVGDHLKAAKSCQQLAISASAAIASFWSEERSQKVFGAGHYRAGWFLLDDDAVELDDPMGWEPLTHDRAWFENETLLLTPTPVPS
jgi:hypothetical protein